MNTRGSIDKDSLPHSTPHKLVYGEVFASSVLEEKSGSELEGYARFSKSSEGIQVIVSVKNALPGIHGIHIHEKGNCSSSDASSAGGHYNPTQAPHGDPNPLRHHIGDLGNIVVGEDGRGVLSLAIPINRFNPDFLDWRKLVGRALIIHSGVDDLESQPTGDSGSRIACGLIVGEDAHTTPIY